MADSLSSALSAVVSLSMTAWADRKFLRRSSLGSRSSGWSCVHAGQHPTVLWSTLRWQWGVAVYKEEMLAVLDGGMLVVGHGGRFAGLTDGDWAVQSNVRGTFTCLVCCVRRQQRLRGVQSWGCRRLAGIG